MMTGLAGRIICTSARRAGLWRALHRAVSPGRVTILAYHAVVRNRLAVADPCFLEEDAFAEQVDFLQRHFDVIPLRDVGERLQRNTLRAPTAVITFDDGYQNNYDLALPILERAGLPATVFLTSNLIGTGEMIWSWRLHRAITETSHETVTWNGTRFALRDRDARAQTARALKRELKALAPEQLDAEVATIVRTLGDDPGRPAETGSPFRMLTREAVREMAGSGLIDFGAHTCSHAILSRLDRKACRREIAQSVTAVSELTGRRCTTFAYPNGRAEDYTPQAFTFLEESGIEAAVTMVRKQNDATTPPFELGRFGVRADMTLRQFAAMLDEAFMMGLAA